MAKQTAKDIKAKLMPKKKKKSKRIFLNTGSTLLNLAMSDKLRGGFAQGRYYLFVGDSESGKTFLALTCLAEAAANPKFDEHRLIHDDVEGGALMDIRKFFGKKVANRLEAPSVDKDSGPVHSESIEDFYYHIDDALKDGRPFIYILDSEDGLTSDQERSKFDKNKSAHRQGDDEKGSYGDGKAKINSANIRRVVSDLKKTRSILIIINQTRDNLGFGFKKKTRSGGHALVFYACASLWASVKGKLAKTVKGKARQIGVQVQIKVEKNRVTGKSRVITLPIFHSYGVDDITSCIDYLISEGQWFKTKDTITAPDFDFAGRMEKLVQLIEQDNLQKDLRHLVAEVWTEIEDACTLKRPPRYGQ